MSHVTTHQCRSNQQLQLLLTFVFLARLAVVCSGGAAISKLQREERCLFVWRGAVGARHGGGALGRGNAHAGV